MNRACLATLVVVLLLGLCTSAPAQESRAASRTIANARRALSAGRYQDAIRLADTVLARSPASRGAAELKVRACIRLGDTARARGSYDAFAAAAGKEDGALLRVVATGELRETAGKAGQDMYLRVAALERLARAGDAEAARELHRNAVDGMATGKGLLADAALARLGDATAVRRLTEAASSPNIRDKSVVAQAIRSAGARDAAFALVPLLRDESPVTRMAAADALAALRFERAIPEIRPLLSDRLGPVRVHGALALKRLGDPGGDELITKLLNGGVMDGKLAALEVTPSMPKSDRAAILDAALKDPEPDNRIKAAEMLARDNPAAARAVLLNLIKDPDLFTRQEAAKALDTVGPPDLAALHELLSDRNAWVRTYAAGGVIAATAR